MELVKLSRINKQEVTVVSSLDVAEKFNKSHDKVLRDIREIHCSDKFRRSNFGETSYKDKWNREQPMYNMTKDGFTLLVMGYTGEKAMKFKEAYIQAFNKMEQLLTQKLTLLWQDTRSYSKLIRKQETDSIKQLVDYAINQGSKNAVRYYSILSKLADKSVGISNREQATIDQLNRLSIVEQIIARCISDGICQALCYKDIFIKCKEQITVFNNMINS